MASVRLSPLQIHAPPTGTPVTPGQRFRYVSHGHIPEHKDNEVLRPFDVVAPATSVLAR